MGLQIEEINIWPKQSSQQRLNEFLVNIQFKGSKVDPSLFYLIEDYIIYILIYIDGMLMIESNQEKVNELISHMGSEFVA